MNEYFTLFHKDGGKYFETWASVFKRTKKGLIFQRYLGLDFLWTAMKGGSTECLIHEYWAFICLAYQPHILNRIFVSLAWISEPHALKQ